MLHTIELEHWEKTVANDIKQQALQALESGAVIFLPQLEFKLLPQEEIFLSATYASPKTKNISFDNQIDHLQGAICTKTESILLGQMMKRYANYSKNLLLNLMPHYQKYLQQARTSFRPVEIAGRKPASFRKDDSRLHVDAFPSTPTQGKRILRVFSNVNPEKKPRIWRLGAPFPKVVEYFYPKLRGPMFGSPFLLHSLKITKSVRTKYDHYMLQLHNAMKADMAYQKQVPQQEQHFPASSTWIVYTDQVSHAAMSGQFTFEQTFYLPPEALLQIEKSPCWILEQFLGKKLLF